MSKFCFKCGKELDDSAVFCSGCGANQQLNTTLTTDDNVSTNVNTNTDTTATLEQQSAKTTSDEQATYTTNTQPNTNGYTRSLVENRSIALSIILSIITCGIYGLFWYAFMTNDANKVSGEYDSTSGGLTILYSLLTCGLYKIYWSYKVGKQLYNAGSNYGKDISDNSILYLILSLFGLSIISDALIQNDLIKYLSYY